MKSYTLTIYGIFDKEDSSVYIGKTNQSLKQRFRNHHFFDKRYYPETKGKNAYNVRILKQVIIFPQYCILREEDFEGYFIDKYRKDGYKILNKQNVIFKNPFYIDNMLDLRTYPSENEKRETIKTERIYNYEVPHVMTGFRYEPSKVNKFIDYILSFDPDNDNPCRWLELYMYVHYETRNIDPPDNWFEIMLNRPYIPFNRLNEFEKVKYDSSIKM